MATDEKATPKPKRTRKTKKDEERDLWQDFANDVADMWHATGPVFVCGRGPGKVGCVVGTRDDFSYYQLKPALDDLLLPTTRSHWHEWRDAGATPTVLVLEDTIRGRDPLEVVTIRTCAPGYYRVPSGRPDVDPPALVYETWIYAMRWHSQFAQTWLAPVFDVPRVRSYETREDAEDGHSSVFCQVTESFDGERGDLDRLFDALDRARCYPVRYPDDWHLHTKVCPALGVLGA